MNILPCVLYLIQTIPLGINKKLRREREIQKILLSYKSNIQHALLVATIIVKIMPVFSQWSDNYVEKNCFNWCWTLFSLIV